MQDTNTESQQPDTELETPPSPAAIFIPPSISKPQVLAGVSYAHFSAFPSLLQAKEPSEAPKCVLGIDEAGRGPVLGPMVYATFYLPSDLHTSLLADTHHFNDSKILTPETRSALMKALCTPDSDLHQSCGWAAKLLSARDISAHMLAPNPYNLNSQALDATIELIQGVLDRGINVEQVYIDTVGQPEAYQKKLERVFPGVRITVAKKADSLYPVVSAASVVAKVTRDAALEVSWEAYAGETRGSQERGENGKGAHQAWGSGYPSDARSMAWLRGSMDPIFGWGPETRFSWGPAKEMLEGKGASVRAQWPVEEEDDGMKMTDFFTSREDDAGTRDELRDWYGKRVSEEVL